MPKHPRLNRLVWFANPAADNRYRILNTDSWYRRIHQELYEVECCLLPAIGNLLGKVSCPTHRKMRTGWMSNHQVESIMDNILYIALIVGAAAVSGQQVTIDSIVTGSNEGVAHRSAKFAGNQYAHRISL